MRIYCVSDLHGNLPEIPECDLLLIAGDIVPTTAHKPEASASWLRQEFRRWLEGLPAQDILGIAGNHDWIFQLRPDLVPSLPWIYLQDSGIEIDGLKIWGTPWQPVFFDWAFNLPESELKLRWKMIPDDIDILITHGPPYGIGDFSTYGNMHAGSPSLLARIGELQPKLSVFGHIHSGYGQYNINETIAVNASLVNEKYEPVNPVRVITL